MKDVSLNATFLIACMSETLVYGIAFALFIISMQYVVTQRRTREGLSKPLVFSSPLLFFFATLHMFGVWVSAYKGFVNFNGNSETYWNMSNSSERTITQVGQVGAIIIGDAMILYRTYMLWGRDLTVVFAPLVAWVGAAVSGIGLLAVQHIPSLQDGTLPNTVTAWTLSFLGTSLVASLTCTVAISYKLFHVRHLGPEKDALQSRRATEEVWRIVVGSAVMYSLNTLLYFSLFAAKNKAQFWFSGVEAPLASTSISLITIRIEWATRESNAVTFTFPNKQPTTGTRWTTGALSIASPRKAAFNITNPHTAKSLDQVKSTPSPEEIEKHTRKLSEVVLDISPTSAAAHHIPDPPLSPYGPDRMV